MIKIFENLHIICLKLQALPGISATKVGSSGAVLGTSLVIAKLFPELKQSLEINERKSITLPSQKNKVNMAPNISKLSACPYLNAKPRTYNAPKGKHTFFSEKAIKTNSIATLNNSSDSEIERVNSKQRTSYWCNFLTTTAITALGLGGTLLALTLRS